MLLTRAAVSSSSSSSSSSCRCLSRRWTSSLSYVNGTFVPHSSASLSIDDLAVVRGFGVFEFLRTYHHQPFHLQDHLLRLQHSADGIGLTLQHSSQDMADIVHATIQRNLHLAPDLHIRILATGGIASDNMLQDDLPHSGSFVVAASPAAYPPSCCYDDGVKVITVPSAVRELPRVKSVNYIGAIVATRRARQAGALEAIYLNARSELTEGARTSFVGIQGTALRTSVGEDVLEGITRKVVLELAAKEDGLLVDTTKPVVLEEVPNLDEAFICSSSKEIVPVVQIDEVTVGDGKPGKVTKRLRDAFQKYAWGS